MDREKYNKLDEELISTLVNDFVTYLDYVYYHINLPEATSTQKRIAEILGENPSRLILEAFRGVGKSWITAVYVTWRLLRDKNEKIMIVSASSPKAVEISQFIRRLFVDVPIINHLEPTKDSRDSVIAFDVAGCEVSIAPSVKSLGITSQLTGSRATLIILDDVEVPSNSATEMQREKLLNRVKEVEAILLPDKPSSVIMLGTPQSIESIYNKLDYPTKVLPAEVPDSPEQYEGKLDDWILTRGKPGDAVDERFPKEILQERKAFYGLAGYKLQFMLDTTLSDEERYPLKLKDLIVYDCMKDKAPIDIHHSYDKQYYINELPNIGFTGDRFQRPSYIADTFEKYNTKVMSIDVSGRGADETAYAIIGVKNGIVYILDVGGVKGYDTESLTTLALKAKEYGVNDIVIERNYSDGMFRSLFEPVLKDIYPCTIYDIWNKGQKELRIIDTIEPLTSNNKVVIDRKLVERDTTEIVKSNTNNVYSLLYQYTHITRDRGSLTHDDRLDALAMAVNHIKDMVIINPKDVVDRMKKQREEKLLDKIFKLAKEQYGTGRKKKYTVLKF